MVTKEQQAELNADLPRSVIKERQGFSYIEGWYAIDRMNKIFGCAGWSYDCEPRLIARESVKDAKGRYVASYNAKCVLRVGDATIGDWGTGHGIDPDEGKSHESAIKEACTDALKRCIKSLGRSMGLSIYDKQQEHVADTAPAAVKGPTVEEVLTLFATTRTPEEHLEAREAMGAIWASVADQAIRETMAKASRESFARTSKKESK